MTLTTVTRENLEGHRGGRTSQGLRSVSQEASSFGGTNIASRATAAFVLVFSRVFQELLIYLRERESVHMWKRGGAEGEGKGLPSRLC